MFALSRASLLPGVALLCACSAEFGDPTGKHRSLQDSPSKQDDTSADTEDSEPDTGQNEGPNLLRNPGFEGGKGSMAGVAPDWTTTDGAAHKQDYLDNRTPYAEKQSQCIATGGAWDQGAILQLVETDTVVAGARYRLRGMIRSESATSIESWYLLGLWWYQDGTFLSEERMEALESLNYDWSSASLEAVAPENANRAAAVLTAHTNGVACYDDLVLARLGG